MNDTADRDTNRDTNEDTDEDTNEDAADGNTVNWTTDPVELEGVDPADPPTHMLPRLWHGGCPVDFAWVRRTGIDVVVDLADPDAYPPADDIEGLTYVKCPLVDADDVPDPGVTLRLAHLVAGLARDGRNVLVHCTFGRNRSGLLVSLVVRDLLGISGAQALAHVQQRRDRTVNNESFARWLRSLPVPPPGREEQPGDLDDRGRAPEARAG